MAPFFTGMYEMARFTYRAFPFLTTVKSPAQIIPAMGSSPAGWLR